MSMTVGNNMGIRSSYLNNTSKSGGYNNIREYSNFLMGKYSCLTPGKNVAVSVTSGMLKKAMCDEKTAQWLERELAKAPDYIKSAQQSALAHGARLTFASIEFGEEYTTMCTCTVTDTPGTDEDIEKWLERVEERKTFKGPDLKSVTDSFIAKMSSLSSTMSTMAGFDMKA